MSEADSTLPVAGCENRPDSDSGSDKEVKVSDSGSDKEVKVSDSGPDKEVKVSLDKTSFDKDSSDKEQKKDHGVKRHANDSNASSGVQSANDWENADMGGDDSRKNKFLRLMGANKAQHKGRFVIGDRKAASLHNRSQTESEQLTENLESQFCQSMDHKLSGGARRHTGLGFRPPSPPPPFSEVPESKERVGPSRVADGEWRPYNRGAEQSANEGVSNRSSTNEDRFNKSFESSSANQSRPKAMYGFVKSSDKS